MKREIFLSFSPNFFRPILYGIKKYEYRKRFCNESTTAYLYLSAPIREVIGIMELGIPLETAELITNVENNQKAIERLQIFIDNGEKFAIPIESIRLYKKPISIKTIKELEPNFFVPQCYLNIKNHEELYKYLNEQELYPEEFFHNHDELYIDNIGCSCREMETMDEFKEKDREYTKNNKYEIIKSGYLTRK